MSSNKPSLTSLSSSMHKRVALAMSKGRPGSLSVPTIRFNPTKEELTTEDAVSEDLSAEESGLSAPSSPPSSPTTTNKISGAVKKSARTQSLDGDSPEGAESTNWSFLNDIKDKITRTVEENLNRFDSIIGSTNKTKSTAADSAVVVASAVEASENCGSAEDVSAEALRDDEPVLEGRVERGKVERSYFEDPESEIRQRKNVDGGRTSPNSSMRFSDLSKLSPSCSLVDESPQLAEEREVPERTPVEEPTKSGTGRAETLTRWMFRNKMRFSRWKVGAVAAFLIYWVFSCSPFLDGFIAGLFLTGLAVRAWILLTRPVRRIGSECITDPVATQTFHCESASGVQKVWMNELLSRVYSPEMFHVNQTQSVLVRLDGSTLRISYTKSRIPKRAMWNEPTFEPQMVYQRIFQLEGATVKLLPEGLARKRHWSRRYPIQIQLLDAPFSRESGVPPHLTKDDPKTVLLFARTGRAKEEWFRLLQSACENQPRDSDAGQEKSRSELSYHVFMNRLIPSPSKEAVSLVSATMDTPSEPPSPFVEIPSSGASTPASPETTAWLNALLGRCFWDFCRDPEWSDVVRRKIQRKLATIKVPSFIEELRLSDIELGTQMPQFGRMSAPTLDRNGLWVDARVTYYGAFRMTLETKLNLLKMKKLATASSSSEDGRSGSPSEAQQRERLSSVYDDAAEETGESSSDDEATNDQDPEEARGGGTTGRKILRLVDSIAQSRYFQQAAEYKYVKKAMEGVSTPLVLTVELVSLNGTLAINIPPPPSDRLWYGFRGNPSLSLVAKPKVGEIELQFSHIIEWIQNKLILELQRILILPNMDDLILPISSSSTGSSSLSKQASVSPKEAASPTASSTSWPAKD